MTYRALDIAKHIISKSTVDQQPVSNMQLQKILYYVQRTFLQNGAVAFNDDFEAWQFGPVIPEVYYMYCGFGAAGIRMEYKMDINKDYASIIDPIVEEKRKLNPWDMVEDTHRQGKAWEEIYNNGIGNRRIIPKELIKEKG